MEKFRNKTKQELTVPGVGVVGPGEIVEAPDNFHNANFEKIGDKKIKENEHANISRRQKLSGNEAGNNGGDAGNS
ncbi:MAG: hypothetical protein PHN89_02730 [Candidatus Pacebacteria bacterium]|nr:hypothetical protein [Candidatus Paceibacterota bacterium]